MRVENIYSFERSTSSFRILLKETNCLKNRFKDTNFKVLETGLKHGTLTLVSKSNKVEITADGERKDMDHYMSDDLAVKAGLNISKNNENFGLNFNLELNEQNGLKDSQVSISLTKVIQNNIGKKIEGLPIDPELEKLFDQLQLARENERLAEITGRAVEENRIMKEMIIQLIKENNKLKTERNLLLKN